MDGDGVITEAVDDRKSGVWRVEFRTPHPNGRGYSECSWLRKGDELGITRRDRMSGPHGTNRLESVLKLHRPVAKSNP